MLLSIPFAVISSQTQKGGDPSRCTPQGVRGRGPSLPCLYSNNCDEKITSKGKMLSGYRKKTAFILSENVAALVDSHGIEKVAFLTLTFPHSLTLKEANRRFHNLSRHVLDAVFPNGWVACREWSDSGRLHFHLVGACAEDVRTGFHFGNYLQMIHLSRRRGSMGAIRKLSRQLTPNPALSALWALLRQSCPKYQFGRSELIPIRKTGKAVAYYIGGYVQKGLWNRPATAKGAKLITYSQNFPKKVNSHLFMWATEGTASWRRKVGLFASLHGIKDLDGLSSRFGSRWAFWFRDLIETLNDGVSALNFESVLPARYSEVALLACRPIAVLAADPFHSIPPRPPVKDDGTYFTIPLPLRSVFAFHVQNWATDRETIWNLKKINDEKK